MSIERWNDDRLDRLANVVEGNARTIQAIANAIAEAGEERHQLFQFIARQEEKIAQQQNEIVGLRTETIRLLDLLINQRNPGNDQGENSTN